MRTIRTKVYKFSELSEPAKQNAIEACAYFNVNDDWYGCIYEDAKNIGLKITGFDIDRSNYCNGVFIEDAIYTAEKIKIEHGEICETYKTAETFLSEYMPIAIKWEKENEGFYFLDEEESQDMCKDFLNSLLEDYLIMLRKEYEYLTSKEAIIETIEANDYEFTKDGKQF